MTTHGSAKRMRDLIATCTQLRASDLILARVELCRSNTFIQPRGRLGQLIDEVLEIAMEACTIFAIVFYRLLVGFKAGFADPKPGARNKGEWKRSLVQLMEVLLFGVNTRLSDHDTERRRASEHTSSAFSGR